MDGETILAYLFVACIIGVIWILTLFGAFLFGAFIQKQIDEEEENDQRRDRNKAVH